MKKLIITTLCFAFASLIISSCDTLSNLPTNTSGGVFSLNGTWKLSSSTDNNALVGTTIIVRPVISNATIKVLANNTYCLRDSDEFWKNVKTASAGGFTLSALVNACNGTSTYKDANVSIVNSDEVTISTRTVTNVELVQHWVRVKNN